MSRNALFGLGAAGAGLALVGALAAGLAGPARAAFPAGAPAAPPLITDRLHHLSGVIAVPPARMRAALRPSAPGFGLLTPPTFGPNVDATLNNAVGAERNDHRDQPGGRSACDRLGQRLPLRPHVPMSTSRPTAARPGPTTRCPAPSAPDLWRPGHGLRHRGATPTSPIWAMPVAVRRAGRHVRLALDRRGPDLQPAHATGGQQHQRRAGRAAGQRIRRRGQQPRQPLLRQRL